MKFKVILIGISILAMSHLVADCSKSEYLKFINKGFSKSEINNICNSTSSTKNKWITPSDSKCISYGGKIDENGICQANWNTAKSICSGVGGRLPTFDELKKVLVDCEEIIDKDNRNKKDSSYQSCYKSKGFFSSNDYWSSSTVKSHDGYAWIMDFVNGGENNSNKANRDYVRCIRAGE